MPCRQTGRAVGDCAEEKRWIAEPDPRPGFLGDRYKPQCLLCGHCGAYVYRPTGVDTFISREEALAYKTQKDEDLRAEQEAYQEEVDRRRHEERKERDEEWQRRYRQHLQSPEWRQMRDAVMERDDGLCQGCMRARATEVHHLTYDTYNRNGPGSEPLWELVAICDRCHRSYHGREDNDYWHRNGP